MTTSKDHLILRSIAYENEYLLSVSNVKLNAMVKNELYAVVNDSYHFYIMQHVSFIISPYQSCMMKHVIVTMVSDFDHSCIIK